MHYKNFYFNIIFRVVLLTLSIFLFFYSLKTNFLITPFLLSGLIIFQVYSLIQFVNKTNRDLASFLESIRFSEFTRSFQIEGMGSSFDELNKAFNDVINDFQKVRSEKDRRIRRAIEDGNVHRMCLESN